MDSGVRAFGSFRCRRGNALCDFSGSRAFFRLKRGGFVLIVPFFSLFLALWGALVPLLFIFVCRAVT